MAYPPKGIAELILRLLCAQTLVNEELKQYFRPEFLNRLDEIIVFRQLSKAEVKEIADIMLKEVRACRCVCRRIGVTFLQCTHALKTADATSEALLVVRR